MRGCAGSRLLAGASDRGPSRWGGEAGCALAATLPGRPPSWRGGSRRENADRGRWLRRMAVMAVPAPPAQGGTPRTSKERYKCSTTTWKGLFPTASVRRSAQASCGRRALRQPSTMSQTAMAITVTTSTARAIRSIPGLTHSNALSASSAAGFSSRPLPSSVSAQRRVHHGEGGCPASAQENGDRQGHLEHQQDRQHQRPHRPQVGVQEREGSLGSADQAVHRVTGESGEQEDRPRRRRSRRSARSRSPAPRAAG